MRLPRQIALILEQHQLFARFWRSASLFWSPTNAWVVGLVVFMVSVMLLQLLMQFLLNLWNRNFFDALERKDAAALWTQAKLFVPLAAASIALAAASVWGRMTTQRSWREALTRHVLQKWIEKDRFRRLNHHIVKGSENPEYRIVVDIRVATDAPVDLTLAFLSSILTSLTFFGVLWSVGGSITVVPFGWPVTIPGYLVFGVIIYSGIVSGLVMLFGHRLTSVIERMNQSEAEFRAAVDAFGAGDHADHSASDAGKRMTAETTLRSVLGRWRELLWQLVRTTFVSQGNTLLAPVVAWFLCVPKYLTGAMSLGELTQAAAAFVVVQTSFNWVVDNYQRLADWRASVHRVATLLLALDDCEASETALSSKT